MKNEKNEWYTLIEASAYSRMSVRSLRESIADGVLVSYKPRKHRLIKRRDLDLFIESARTLVPVP